MLFYVLYVFFHSYHSDLLVHRCSYETRERENGEFNNKDTLEEKEKKKKKQANVSLIKTFVKETFDVINEDFMVRLEDE